MIATDSSKQQALNADPKAMQKNYFYRKSRTRWKYKIAFYYWRDERNYFRFFTSTLKLLRIYFALIKYQFKITQYNTLNVKLSKSQLSRLKSGIKEDTEVTLNLLSNFIGNSLHNIFFCIYYCQVIYKFRGLVNLCE